MKIQTYQIPNLFESLAMDITCGKMTFEEASCELNRYNYMPYVDAEQTQKILSPYIAKINAQKGATK